MKKVIAVFAVVVAVAFLGATVAGAGQCPLLHKQLDDAFAKEKDPKKKEAADKLIKASKKDHADGKHADSVKEADAAAKVLGIKLEKKM